MFKAIAKFLEAYKDSLIAVTWFIAAFSLFFTNRKEIRKEIRSEVDAINKGIGELVAKFRKCYLTSPS